MQPVTWPVEILGEIDRAVIRQRERDLELSGDFYSIVKRDGFERTAPNRIAFEPKKYLEDHPKRPYHASLKGGLGSLGV